MNEWSKKPKKSAVSADQFGALTLLQIALERRTRITLLFSSGSGLTLEGPQGQTYAMGRILQLCNALQFKEGDGSLIKNVIFPKPLIPISIILYLFSCLFLGRCNWLDALESLFF